MDPLLSLVRIADKLNDSPISVVHRLLVQPTTSMCFSPLGDIVLPHRANW